MSDTEPTSSPVQRPDSSPTEASRKSPDVASSPLNRKHSRSSSRSHSRGSRSRSRSHEHRRRLPRSRSRSAGRRSQHRFNNLRALAGNYGNAGGNNNPRLPVVDAMSKFPMTCHFWKNNSCLKGAEKCSYLHAYVCRNDINCPRTNCRDVHIKSRRQNYYQGGNRGGYHRSGRGGMRGGGRGRGYGYNSGGYSRDGGRDYRDHRGGGYRDGGYNNRGYGDRQSWGQHPARNRDFSDERDRRKSGGGREGSLTRHYDKRSSERYRSSSREKRSRTRSLDSSRSRSRERQRSGSRDRSSSGSSRGGSANRRSRSRSFSEERKSRRRRRISRSESGSRHRSASKEHNESLDSSVDEKKIKIWKSKEKTLSAVDPEKVANMLKDDMDLSQETIEKLMQAVNSNQKKGASSGEGFLQHSKKTKQMVLEEMDHDDALNDFTASLIEDDDEDNRDSLFPITGDVTPPMKPPPPPKVTAADINMEIPSTHKALKGGLKTFVSSGSKDLWTPMSERASYDSRMASAEEQGLSRWEIDTPYISRQKGNDSSSSETTLASSKLQQQQQQAITAKGISSELDSLFTNTFDNRYKEPEVEDSKDATLSSEENSTKSYQPQGTSEALNWLLRKRQEAAAAAAAAAAEKTKTEEEDDKIGGSLAAIRKRARSESSESSSSDGSEEEKTKLECDGETSAKGDKLDGAGGGGSAVTKLTLIAKKNSILKNMKMLMEQKTHLDSQKEELSRTHRGSDEVLQGILVENSILNEEITKQIKNMCALVDDINKSLEEMEDDDDDQTKGKSKKSKKKKARKKHKKEKRHKDSHESDDDHKGSKLDKSVIKGKKFEKKYPSMDEDRGDENGICIPVSSPVVAPRYWDIVKPLSAAADDVNNRDKSPAFRDRSPGYDYDKREHHWEESRKEYRKEYDSRDGWEDYDGSKRRFYEGNNKGERMYDDRKRDGGFVHGRDQDSFDRHRRVPAQTRMHDPRHDGRAESESKSRGRVLQRVSQSPNAEDVASMTVKKYCRGMYADQIEGKESSLQERLSLAVKTPKEEGVDKVAGGSEEQQGTTARTKEKVLNRIKAMQLKKADKGIRKKQLTTAEVKKPADVQEAENDVNVLDTTAIVEDIAEVGKPDSPAPYIDQGMHWCDLCNFFCDTLPHFVQHLLADEHLAKLTLDDQPWHQQLGLSSSGGGTISAEALTRPLQGVEFLHSVTTYYCSLCHCHTGSDAAAAATHFHTDQHIQQYKSHTQNNPLYESTFFKAKMNAYAKYMMGRNQEETALSSSAAKKITPVKKGTRGSFFDALHSSQTTITTAVEQSVTKQIEVPSAKKHLLQGFAQEKRAKHFEDVAMQESKNDISLKKGVRSQWDTPVANRKGSTSGASDNRTRTPASNENNAKMQGRHQVSQTPKSSSEGIDNSRSSHGSSQRSGGRAKSPSPKGEDGQRQNMQPSIRVVARAFGGSHKLDDAQLSSGGEEGSTGRQKRPAGEGGPHDEVRGGAKKTVGSESQAAVSVDSFMSKLDENDRMIEQLKKKVARRIQEKRQAQSKREEEEAKNREEEEKEARKKLEEKLDKLSRPKAVVEEKKSHSRFPLIGKMPFFKSKPTKAVVGKSKDSSGSSKQIDGNDGEPSSPSSPNQSFESVVQDIEDPKFSRLKEDETTESPSRDKADISEETIEKSQEDPPLKKTFDDESRPTITTRSKKGKLNAASRSSDEFDDLPKSHRAKAMSMSIFDTEVDTMEKKSPAKNVEKSVKEKVPDAKKTAEKSKHVDGQTSSKSSLQISKKKVISDDAIINTGGKSTFLKSKNIKPPKSKKAKTSENIASSITKKSKTSKLVAKAEAIGPVLPLVNIPLPIESSGHVTSAVTTPLKSPLGYSKAKKVGKNSSSVVSAATPAPSSLYSAECVPMSTAAFTSACHMYGYPTYMNPYTTAAPTTGNMYTSYHNTSGSPLSVPPGYIPDGNSCVNSGGGGIMSPAAIAGPPPSVVVAVPPPSVSAPGGMPDYTALFSQPPPTATMVAAMHSNASPDMMLHTSSPTTSMATGHPKRDVTPPPPGTEVDSEAPVAVDNSNSSSSNNNSNIKGSSTKSAFDAEEDLLPPGVEPEEMDTKNTNPTDSRHSVDFASNHYGGISLGYEHLACSTTSSESRNIATSEISLSQERPGNQDDMDVTAEMLTHAIPTRAQIDSRLVEAGQLSPSALLEAPDED